MTIYKVTKEENTKDGIKKLNEIFFSSHRYTIRYIINEIYKYLKNENKLSQNYIQTKDYFVGIKNDIKLNNKYTFNNINYIIEEIEVYYEDYYDEHIKSMVHDSCY